VSETEKEHRIILLEFYSSNHFDFFQVMCEIAVKQ